MYNIVEYQYQHIAGSGTTVCFLGRGNLGSLNINTATAVAAITVMDSTTGLDGTTIAILASGTPAGDYLHGVSISKGLVVLTTGASDVTALYTKG